MYVRSHSAASYCSGPVFNRAMASSSSVQLKLLVGPSCGRDFRTNKIAIAAAAAGVPLRVNEANSKQGPPAPGLTPFGQYPLLLTPAGVVPRTNAIVRYICGLREDAGLLGATLFDEAAVDQWLEWSATSLELLVVTLVTPAASFPPGVAPAAIEGAQRSVIASLPLCLAVLDSHLASRTYLVGERPTAADYGVAAVLHALVSSGKLPPVVAAGDVMLPAGATPLEAFPALARWYLTCRHLPPFAAVCGPVGADGGLGGGAKAPASAAAAGKVAAGKSGGGGSSASTTTTTHSGAAATASTAAALGGGVVNGCMLPTALTAIETSLPHPKYGRTRTRIGDLLATGATLVGGSTGVVVCGWARTVREAGAGAILFVALNDGSCFENLQV